MPRAWGFSGEAWAAVAFSVTRHRPAGFHLIRYAYRLKKAFAGFGTNDKAVCRILGCADKPDAIAIAAAFQKKYAKPLRAMIKSECSGDYQRLQP